MRRTKAANKVNVTFDYETELFVPVEDGEFILIDNGNQDSQPIVLPRASRFASRRDFYEFYQDYYHCNKPDAGEVHIIQPATVVSTTDGWKPQAAGILEVLGDQPKKKASAAAIRNEVITLAREEPQLSVAAIKEESPVTPCTDCGSLVETRYAFCWKCGNPLTRRPSENESSVTHWEDAGATMSPVEFATEDEELTVQHDLRPVGSPTFSWAMAKEPEGIKSAKGSVLKLVALVGVGLIIVTLGLFVLTRSASRITSVTAAQPDTGPVSVNGQSDPSLSPGRAIENDVATERTPQRTSAARPEDDELETLRERRIAATASERLAILDAFATAEKQYPNDYRFPYERAKLAIRRSQSSSHEEAFSALALAAEKAINTGKASEMLHGLETDKAGDFHKLSRGHHEWNQLAEALKNKDMHLLTRKVRF